MMVNHKTKKVRQTSIPLTIIICIGTQFDLNSIAEEHQQKHLKRRNSAYTRFTLSMNRIRMKIKVIFSPYCNFAIQTLSRPYVRLPSADVYLQYRPTADECVELDPC